MVLGDGIVDGLCGPKAIDGDMALLDVSGQLSSAVGTHDLYADRVPVAPSCAAATDPALGVSPSAGSTVVYTSPIVVTGAVAMQPGRYVFCQGLELRDGAALTGTDVMLQPRTAPEGPESTLSIEEVLDELIAPLGIPAIANVPVGHGKHMATMPLGARVRVDGDLKKLEVIESAVESA